VRDLQKGLSISILVHGLILSAVLGVSVNKPVHPEIMWLDFSILNFERSSDRAGELTGDRHAGPEAALRKSVKAEKAKAPQVDDKSRTVEPYVGPSTLSTPVSHGSVGIVSDRDGQIEVSGKQGSFSGDGGPGADTTSPPRAGQSPGSGEYGGSEGRTIRYGSGSAGEKVFHFIRDGVMKNVRYPEKARRKGLAGRIVLSFTVTEGGITRDVKVINGSGFVELDNTAKEAVARTTFSQKIPYKLFVILPIEYRLE